MPVINPFNTEFMLARKRVIKNSRQNFIKTDEHLVADGRMHTVSSTYGFYFFNFV